jgi:release factor glutamine methyltransferase
MGTIKELYLEAKKRLEKAGIADPAFDAACIIEKHTGMARHEIILYGSRSVQCDTKAFWEDISRRIQREPLQYIIGTWPFYGLDFYVGKGVLIPRPDTEILCQTAVDFLKKRKSPKLLELCGKRLPFNSHC